MTDDINPHRTRFSADLKTMFVMAVGLVSATIAATIGYHRLQEHMRELTIGLAAVRTDIARIDGAATAAAAAAAREEVRQMIRGATVARGKIVLSE